MRGEKFRLQTALNYKCKLTTFIHNSVLVVCKYHPPFSIKTPAFRNNSFPLKKKHILSSSTKKFKTLNVFQARMQEIEGTSSIHLTENYTYDVPGFSYHPGSSMTGIFFLDNDRRPCFNYMRPYPSLGLPQPSFFSIPSPFTILSSVRGLILCRDDVTYSYHVLNPFIHTDASYRRIPDPPRSHRYCPHAVLALNLQNSTEPCFNIICPVQEADVRRGHYLFDTYSSVHNAWFQQDELFKCRSQIMINSGISSSRGIAFWLTEVPHALIKYEIVNDDFESIKEIDLPRGLWPWVRVQIGRIDGDVGVGLVASTSHDVRLFLLRDEDWYSRSWEELCFLNVNGRSQRGGSMLVCKQKLAPEILRYEKEVPLWIDGRIVLWEIFKNGVSIGPGMTGKLHEMPSWNKRPDPIANSIPYVHTESIPANFPVIYVHSDDDDDDDDILE